MTEAISGMLFLAGLAAFVSLIVLSLSKRAKRDMRFAFGVQFTIILGIGFLGFVGAGLQSPPGYPHFGLPVVFILMLAGAHAVWRWAHPREGD